VSNYWGLFETVAGRLAIPGERLIEVVETPPSFQLPLTPPGCRGVFPFRGQLAVALDSNCYGGKVGDSCGNLVVVCSSDSGMVGLPVRKVVRVTKLENLKFLPVTEGQVDKPDGWLGDIEFDGRNYATIELDRMLESLLRH